MKRQCLVANQRGDTLIITVFSVVALMGIVAAVFRFGFLSYNKTQLQNAADAAALAGANVLVASPTLNQANAVATAKTMAAAAPGQSSDVVTVTVAADGSSIVVQTSRLVQGIGSKTIHATATAKIVPAGGINNAPGLVITDQTANFTQQSDWDKSYTMRMLNKDSQYYSQELAMPNGFDYADVVFTSDYTTAANTYLDLCKYGDPNLCLTTTPLYYWGHSSAETTAITATDSRLTLSTSKSKYNPDTHQYEPPLTAGDPRLMTFPMVKSLPPRTTQEFTCKNLDSLAITGFIGFVIDSVDNGTKTETLYHSDGTPYLAYPLNAITGHFIRLNVSGVPVGTGSITGLTPTTVQLVTNTTPEDDY